VPRFIEIPPLSTKILHPAKQVLMDKRTPDGIPDTIIPLAAYCWQQRHKNAQTTYREFRKSSLLHDSRRCLIGHRSDSLVHTVSPAHHQIPGQFPKHGQDLPWKWSTNKMADCDF